VIWPSITSRYSEDGVPHEGQDAIREVVCKVRVISSAASTSSIWTSGRSREMIIGFGWFLEKVCMYGKMFNFSVYHIYFQQGCVTTNDCQITQILALSARTDDHREKAIIFSPDRAILPARANKY
jgi:hypothetical protein